MVNDWELLLPNPSEFGNIWGYFPLFNFGGMSLQATLTGQSAAKRHASTQLPSMAGNHLVQILTLPDLRNPDVGTPNSFKQFLSKCITKSYGDRLCPSLFEIKGGLSLYFFYT
jgi:hypothetical protein